MLFDVLFILVVVQVLSVPVLSEAPPAPPANIRVDNWLLTWTPATEEAGVTYTVQYSSFDSGVWTNVPSCVHMSLNSCNVISTKAEGEHGCVMLRVRAEKKGGLNSAPVQACSRHGDTCTPDFSLTAGPGSLTVHLSRNHSLALEHADHAKHRVYYGKEGEPLQDFEDAVASVTLRDLQQGQRYCTQVQYIYFDDTVGLPACTRCELVPKSKVIAEVLVPVVIVVVVLILLIPVVAYVLIFQYDRIKRWLLPPAYRIPDNILERFPEQHLPLSSNNTPTEEHYDIISSISPQDSRQ